ncbi:MAG TPA: hypothetical protein VNO24_24455 [Blastocatellia bacterium]|nr:hypothetical protein [Blastocatellia bacterium]
MTANISSVASTLTPPTGSVYNTTKAAVDAITKTSTEAENHLWTDEEI